MKVYTGSAWVDAYAAGSSFLAKANNLSDLTNTSTARTNLGVAIGTDVLSPSGSGASLTSLNASNISSGTLGEARLPAFSGDASSTAGTSSLTLATVNSNTGSFGSTTVVPVITVNGKGLITAVSTANISAGSGTVTSVAATVPSFLSVTGSPITTSGTLALTYSGTALPIANGGTGETTRQNAMDALAGAVTSGQYLRGNGTDVVMSAIQAADVPTLNQNTTGTASNVTGTVAVANGGTGQTSYTNGQLLIGNTTGNTLTKATLTAGDGISITNGSGSITVINTLAPYSADYVMIAGGGAGAGNAGGGGGAGGYRSGTTNLSPSTTSELAVLEQQLQEYQETILQLLV